MLIQIIPQKFRFLTSLQSPYTFFPLLAPSASTPIIPSSQKSSEVGKEDRMGFIVKT